MTAAETRASWGVEGAYRDAKAPRLLVIRVGAPWYERSAADRRTQAQTWQTLWRQNVPQGIVAILDAGTNAPAVQFGGDGEVTGLAAAPPKPK
jgi:hypothetical protein